MDMSAIANAALAAGCFALFALPALSKRETRGWVPAVFVIALIDSFATLLPLIDKRFELIHGSWNWTGKLFSLGAMLLVALFLVATRRLSARDIGLTLRQAPGTGRALL